MSNEYVIITAGGKGTRMGSDLPKQFIELNGIPVIIHSIKAFSDYSPSIKFIVVLPEVYLEEWDILLKKHDLRLDYEICAGGETRFDSVKNGLAMIEGDGMVAIHDAARPLISVSLISNCFLLAAQKGNAVPVIHLQDSMREISGEESRPVERDKFRLVQTPQVFDVSLIKKAYEKAYRASFTDDATVAEAFGVKINLLEGEKKNIKITNQDDLLFAKTCLQE